MLRLQVLVGKRGQQVTNLDLLLIRQLGGRKLPHVEDNTCHPHNELYGYADVYFLTD